VQEEDATTFTITLTEQQRVDAIAASNTPGGDGSAVVFGMFDGAIPNIGTRRNQVSRVTSLPRHFHVMPRH